MANVVGSGKWVAKGVYRMTWSGFTTTVTGTANSLDAPHLPIKTVSLFGTIGSGTTITIQGAPTATVAASGTNWFTLNDAQGTALTLSTGKVKPILENPAQIRPRLTAKNANTNVSIIIEAQSVHR